LLSFDENNNNGTGEEKLNVPVNLFINSGHKFFAQMLGRDGMSMSWCMYCKTHPKDWKGVPSVPAIELWSVAQQFQYDENINRGKRLGTKKVL
jgi:hypothetical protein